MSDLASVDIAIVGGGLVGTPLAIMLAHQGWRVALLEQQASLNAARGAKGFTALSDSTVGTLSTANLWANASGDACAIREVHVSHKGYFGSTRIDGEEHAVEALGYVVDNATFLESFQIALEHSAVHRFSGASVQRVEYQDQNAIVHYSVGDKSNSLEAKLVIAVDGVSSSLRDAAGIATQHTDYDQVGILGTVEFSEEHANVAYERFTPSGPLALLPRPGRCASFVYCINPDSQDAMQSLSDDAFLDELQSAFGYRLGKFTSVGPRHFVPLVRIEATQQYATRLLLLGNAMRLLHPVAGQGYNLAMRDVEQLVNELTNTELDPGDINTLRSYAESRLSDHKQVVRMTDLLARTFRGQASMPAHMRALGLLGLDRFPALRQRFTERSMGHVGPSSSAR